MRKRIGFNIINWKKAGDYLSVFFLSLFINVFKIDNVILDLKLFIKCFPVEFINTIFVCSKPKIALVVLVNAE